MAVNFMLGFIFTILDIMFGVLPVVMFIVVVFTIIKMVKKMGNGGKSSEHENPDKPKSAHQLKLEEIETKLRNLYAEKNAERELAKQPDEKNEKVENFFETSDDKIFKSNRCKNCGAELERDKNGRKKCPYCQSKYF